MSDHTCECEWNDYSGMSWCSLHESAPELLEACKRMYYALQIGHNDYTDYGARVAIAKAEGVQ